MVKTMKTGRISRWLAWALCTLVILGSVAGLIMSLRNQAADAHVFDLLLTFLNFFVLPTVYGVVGALVIAHHPRNIVGWLLMMEAMLVFFWPLDAYFSNLPQAPAQPTPLTYLGLWLYGWGWLWFIFPILFIPLFFPTGRLLSPRWRWVVILGLGSCLFFITIATFTTRFMQHNEAWSLPNPIGFIPTESFPMVPWSVALLSFVALCTASIFIRYRRARGAERQQVKWFFAAAGLFAAIYTITFLFNVNEAGGLLGSVLDILFVLAPLLLPLAIGAAILRYRLYDIDIIIRKTLVYTVLTLLLVLVYFGVVVLLQAVFESASGEQSPIVIVVSTLVIAALFAPLRLRVQAVIDRRFFRKKYDAQQVLARFAQTARDETDMDVLTAELVQVVQETMQPEMVSLWTIHRQKSVVDKSFGHRQ
jgi:hypothetical protein